MLRRILPALGGSIMVLGGVFELAAIALPWVRYHLRATVAQAPTVLTGTPGVSVFRVAGGSRYLGLLLLTVLALAGAVTGPVRWRAGLSSVTFLFGVLGAVVAVNIGNHAAGTGVQTQALGLAMVRAQGSAGPGVPVGAAGTILLGVGAVVAAWAAGRVAPDVSPEASPDPAAGAGPGMIRDVAGGAS